MSDEESVVELYDESIQIRQQYQTATSLRVIHLEDFEAPFTLPSEDREAYLRRFATLFVDESRMREGSTGKIFQAVNAFGERFALKEYEDTSAQRIDHEYGAHRLVSGIKGYPTLYGKAHVAGKPALVMEWIEGEDLLHVHARLAIDDEGRISPLTAARLGRDLFDVLARTNVLENTMVHGDLSLRNIMVNALRQSVEEQTQEGSFDLRLIDMGSACFDKASHANGHGQDRSNGDESAYVVAATPEFAAPELKEDSNVRCTPASDVYAAARIICHLLCGNETSSFVTAHGSGDDIAAVLLREPEVAVAVNHASAGLSPAPSLEQIALALELADEPLADLLKCCLDEDPKKRPSASAMRDALDSFCASYASNISHALRGEDLEPCRAPFINKGLSRFSLQVRNTIRIVGKSVSWGLLAAVLVITAIANQASAASVNWGDVRLEGFAAETLVALLLVPPLVGRVLRGKNPRKVLGLVRASAGILIVGSSLMYLMLAGQFDPRAFQQLMESAVFASAIMGWCPLVLDCAFPSISASVRRRYRALPEPAIDEAGESERVRALGEKADDAQGVQEERDDECD